MREFTLKLAVKDTMVMSDLQDMIDGLDIWMKTNVPGYIIVQMEVESQWIGEDET